MSESLLGILKTSLSSRSPLTIKTFVFSVYFRGLRQITQKQHFELETSAQSYQKSKINEKSTRNTLQTILEIKEFEALKLTTTNKKLVLAPNSLIIKNYEICIENKINKEVILKYPFLLCEENLTKKIARLEQLPINISFSIPLAQLGIRRLYSVLLNATETINKVNDLCTIFDVTVDKACDILSKKTFLFSKPISELEELLNIFYEYGFNRHDILNDLWNFKYSASYIKNRLDFVKENGIQFPKTWMIRCPEETLYKHIKRESDNRDILGENSVAQYLSEKLDCSECIAKSLIRKHPQLQNKSLLKINVMIELLYQRGFTPTQICKFPKVLLHSTKTTDQRLKQLSTLGKKPDTLYILTKSQKQYLQHIENLIKSKAKVECSV